MRVEPPTSTISSMSPAFSPASASARSNGPRQRSTRSRVSSSNLARVRLTSRWTGPSGVLLMNGRLMLVCVTLDSSIFAFSAASRTRCMACLSFLRSMPFSFLNSSAT